MRFWRIGKTEPGEFEADDLTGRGAALYGGRWSSKGQRAVYGSFNPATAVLEGLAHLGHNRQPTDRYLVAIDIPDEIANDRAHGLMIAANPPAHWDAIPAHQATQLYGDRWIASGQSLGLIVPSAFVREESNLVLNPQHPEMVRVRAVIMRPFVFDRRL
jgi:RES domain-containing protein